MRHTLQCDMTKTYTQSVTHIGAKGYAYCAAHARARQSAERCRKMTARETRQIANNQPIQYASVTEPCAMCCNRGHYPIGTTCPQCNGNGWITNIEPIPRLWAQERGTE